MRQLGQFNMYAAMLNKGAILNAAYSRFLADQITRLEQRR